MTHDQFLAAIREGDRVRFDAGLADHPGWASRHPGGSAVLTAIYHNKPDLLAALLANDPELDVFEASAVGDVARLAALVSGPEESNARNDDGFQPLGLACFFGHADCAQFLIERGADPSSPSENSFRVAPIHSAAARGSLEIVRILTAAGADVNAVQQGRFTALHEAARQGRADIVDELMSAGAVCRPAESGETPADLAQANGHATLALRLLP